MAGPVMDTKFGNMGDWFSDAKKCRNGVPCDIGEGRTILVKRAGTMNRAYLAAAIGVDMDDAAALAKLVAGTLVYGWEGVLDADGKPMPFSPDACESLFAQAPELCSVIFFFANARRHYRADELTEDKRAVKTRSGGSKAQAHSLAS